MTAQHLHIGIALLKGSNKSHNPVVKRAQMSNQVNEIKMTTWTEEGIFQAFLQNSIGVIRIM